MSGDAHHVISIGGTIAEAIRGEEIAADDPGAIFSLAAGLCALHLEGCQDRESNSIDVFSYVAGMAVAYAHAELTLDTFR